MECLEVTASHIDYMQLPDAPHRQPSKQSEGVRGGNLNLALRE
jgi:hypothetical protein